MRTEHIRSKSYRYFALRPAALHIRKLLRLNTNHRLVATPSKSPHAACHTDRLHRQLKGSASALGYHAINSVFKYLAGYRPAVPPQKRTDGKGAASAQIKVRLKVERHLLHAFFNNESAEMAGAHATLFARKNKLAATLNHVAAYIVIIRSGRALGAADDNIVCRIGSVTAGSVSSQKIIPSVVICHLGRLA